MCRTCDKKKGIKIMKILPINNYQTQNSQKSNQTPFGMIINLTPKAEGLFKPEALAQIRSLFKDVRLKSGKEIFIEGKIASRDDSISLSAFVGKGLPSVNNIIVSHAIGKSTYESGRHEEFQESVDFALRNMANTLELLG